MFRLILKDILIQKRTILISFAYSFLALFVFKKAVAPVGSLFVGAVAIAYIFITYSMSYDDKNNSHVVLNSLPIKREQIVLARYLSIFIFGLIGIIMMLITGTLASVIGVSVENYSINLESILTVFAVLLFIYSLYYPLYFKFGAVKMNIANVLMFMLVIFLPSFLLEKLTKNDSTFIKSLIHFIEKMPEASFKLSIAVIIFLLAFLSIGFSMKIYNRRDF